MYYENISCLHSILQQAGYDCWVGSLHPDLRQTKTITLSNNELTLHPIDRVEQHIEVAVNACLILTNNDFSNVPDALHNIEQATMHPNLGWHSRKKTHHFQHYQAICGEFAALIGVTPWSLNGLFAHQANVDFKSGQGLAELKEKLINCLLRLPTYRANDLKTVRGG